MSIEISWQGQIRENWQQVQARIAAAALRAGRSPDDVTLVAVSKYARLKWILALYDLGQRHFGENRPQQLEERAGQLPPDIIWHLIGHLQSNKARRMMQAAGWLHSIDSIKLLQAINRLATELAVQPRVLLEVNIAGEEQKDGFAPEILRASWDVVCTCQALNVCGLMTMAPLADAAERARPVFRQLRQLGTELSARSSDSPKLTQFSMGMTGDFEVAIEEGATIVRIGSALWQGLEPDG